MKKIDITDFSGGINVRFAPEDFKVNESFELTGLMITNEQTLRSQPPLQTISNYNSGQPPLDFREIRPLVNPNGTQYIIGITESNEVWHTLVHSSGDAGDVAKGYNWTRVFAVNPVGSASFTVANNAHIISNFSFTTPYSLYPGQPAIQTVPALLITNSYNIGTSVDQPYVVFALPGVVPQAYRLLDNAGNPAIYPGYLPTNPQNVVSTYMASLVSVTWSAPSNPGSSAITNYYIYDRNGTLKATVPANQFSVGFAGVSGDEVGVRVRAGNSYGITPFDVGGEVRVPATGYVPRANVGVFWNGYLVLGDIEYYRDVSDISKNIPLSNSNSTRIRNGIWFSTPDNPTQFDPLAQFVIGQPDSQITSMIVIPAGLLVFTKTVASESGIFLLRGTSPGVVTSDELVLNFTQELVRGGLGTRAFPNADVSHNVAAAWPGTGTVVFLDENGLVWQTDGQNVKLISENILNVQLQQVQPYDNITTWDKYIFVGLQNRLFVGREFGERIAWTNFILPPSTRAVQALPPNGPKSMFEINNQIYFIWNDGTNRRVWRYLMTPQIQSNAFFEYGKIDLELTDLILTTRPVRDTDMHEKTFWHSVGLRFRPQLFTPFGPTPPSTKTNNFKIKEYKCGISPLTTFGFTPTDTVFFNIFSPPLEYPFTNSSTSRGEKKFKAHGPSLEAQARFVFQGHVDIEGVTFYGHGRKPVNQ
jgi:hypothetical protein